MFDDERAAKAARKERWLSGKHKAAASPTPSRPAKWALIGLRGRDLGLEHPSQLPVDRNHDTVAASHNGGGNVDETGSESGDSENEEGGVGTTQADATPGESGVPMWHEVMGSAIKARRQTGRPASEKRRTKKELDVGMDYLINAGTRTGLMCRRKVFDVYCTLITTLRVGTLAVIKLICDSFSFFPSVSDHLDCAADQPTGCPHCCVPQPTICCDLHHPSEFQVFISMVPKSPTMPQRSRIPKYSKDCHDIALQKALHDWCVAKTATVYGWSHLHDIGPCIVMPNLTLEHIVDCAHHRKINNAQDLRCEMGWPDAELYNGEIIMLLQKHAPPLSTPFITIPLKFTTSSAINASSSLLTPSSATLPAAAGTSNGLPVANVPKCQNKCGACGTTGHNSTYGLMLLNTCLDFFRSS